MSTKQPTDEPSLVLRVSRQHLRLAGVAFAIGVLLCLLAMWLGRDKGFYKIEPVASGGSDIPALPEPQVAGGDASGLQAPPAQAEKPQLVEEPAPPPAPAPTPVEAPAPPPLSAPAPELPAGNERVALAPGELPVPLREQNPAPEYPGAALRRGDTGTVVVRVMVSAEGLPTEVSVAKRSGSRDLDRAALDAVRRWRFQPAQRDGQPVAASVDIPIDFNLQR